MKKTTQFMLALSAMTIMGTAVSAQTRSIDMDAVLNDPAQGMTVVSGQPMPIAAEITNNGPDNLIVGDTIFFYVKVGNGQSGIVASVLKQAIDSGQIFSFSSGLTPQNDAGGTTTIDVCFHVVNPNTEGLNVNGAPVLVSYNDPNLDNNEYCNDVTLVDKEDSSSSAIAELSNASKEQLMLYPNPARNEVFFKLNNKGMVNATASLKDITGREVLHYNYGKVAAGNQPLKLDVSGLNPGLYFIELNADNKKSVGKVMIQQ